MNTLRFMAVLGLGMTTMDFTLAINNDPIILVHGLSLSGAFWQYADTLKNEGFEVYAVSVGKFTSNFDRAVEVYSQVKGTVIDWGACHSAEMGHLRFGKNFTGQGLFPAWNEKNPVHLIGHSMGAPTIRVLERLLREGSGCPQDTHELFQGGKNWITSITTMSGVLDGTPLVDVLDNRGLLDVVEGLIVGIAGLIDNGAVDDFYDIDFSQWGLEREEGESFEDFWQRVEDSGFLSKENLDTWAYDLSTEGARLFSSKGVLEYNDTYYFSFATERSQPEDDCTFQDCEAGLEEPEREMTLFLKVTSLIIGQRVADPERRKNDGLVSWIDQLCPNVEPSETRGRCTEYTGIWPRGQWVYKDISYLDHMQIIIKDYYDDFFNYENSAKKIYVDHAQRLKELPSKIELLFGTRNSASNPSFSYMALLVYFMVVVAFSLRA